MLAVRMRLVQILTKMRIFVGYSGTVIMKKEAVEPILSAVFVDYDNVYLSLQRKSEEAARLFARHSYTWVDTIASGALVTQTKSFSNPVRRRLVMNRCYGNTVPRRNASNSETDMHSFAFVRHHFLQSGFEIVDCPPLNGHQKNSSDIRMVMDIRDYLDHKTEFDEFIILSSDADFTPVLHRLRAHAKRTVIFTSDSTAGHYTALSDGEVREDDLIACLLSEQIGAENRIALPQSEDLSALRHQIVDLVVQSVLEADFPLSLEALEERATHVLGQEKTVGSDWGSAGSLHELLSTSLPNTIGLTDSAPYFAFDTARVMPAKTLPAGPAPMQKFGNYNAEAGAQTGAGSRTMEPQPAAASNETQHASSRHAGGASSAAHSERPSSSTAGAMAPQDLQDAISRIHAACEAPPFSPPEYRAIFTLLEREISEHQFQGVKTLQNVAHRAAEIGIKMSADDARYMLDAVTQGDPWLEQGGSANLFARRFHDYVVSRCRNNGLSLSKEELELIDAWFVSAPNPDGSLHQSTAASPAGASASARQETARPTTLQDALAASDAQNKQAQQTSQGGTHWWNSRNAADQSVQPLQYSSSGQQAGGNDLVMKGAATNSQASAGGEFPRILRNRLRN